MIRIARRLCACLCLSIVVVGLSARGEEVKVPIDKLPRAVVEGVKVRYKGAELVSAVRDTTENGAFLYEVNLTQGGHKIEVSLTAEGRITLTVAEMDAKDLPQTVRKILDDKYAKATFLRVVEVAQGGMVTYEVLIETPDKKTFEVVLEAQGIISAAETTPEPAAGPAQKVEVDQLPRKVADAVKARFPGATILVISKETEKGTVLYDIEMKQNFRKHEMDVREDGTVVDVENEIEVKDLPTVCANAVKAKYPRCSIKEVMEVSVMKDNKEVKDHYEVLIATAELKEVELTVTLDGKIE